MTNLTPNFTPLGDLILVKPDPEPEKIDSIFVATGYQPQGHKAGRGDECFAGTVVAVGPGDRHKPFASLTCPACRSKRFFEVEMDSYLCECPKGAIPRDLAERWDAGRYPMLTKVGDRVIFPRRPSSPVGTDPRFSAGGDSGLRIDGELYLLFHEEQSCFAVIEA